MQLQIKYCLTKLIVLKKIPDESEYFFTKDNKDFMIFKNNKIIIFQSPNQAKIQISHCEIIEVLYIYQNLN